MCWKPSHQLIYRKISLRISTEKEPPLPSISRLWSLDLPMFRNFPDYGYATVQMWSFLFTDTRAHQSNSQRDILVYFYQYFYAISAPLPVTWIQIECAGGWGRLYTSAVPVSPSPPVGWSNWYLWVPCLLFAGTTYPCRCESWTRGRDIIGMMDQLQDGKMSHLQWLLVEFRMHRKEKHEVGLFIIIKIQLSLCWTPKYYLETMWGPHGMAGGRADGWDDEGRRWKS